MPSVKSAEGKAAQRERNKGADGKPATRSGSSGTALKTSAMPSKLWEEIEGDVKHLADIAGRISHSQVGSAGQMIATINCPLEYAHDLLDVHLKARDGMVYMRLYYVSLEDYLGPMAGDDDECDVCLDTGFVDDPDNDGGSIDCPECCS